MCIRDRINDLTSVIDDIEMDASLDGEDYYHNERWIELQDERGELIDEINLFERTMRTDKGFDVWGVRLSDEDIEKILDKGFKISKFPQTTEERLA